MKERERQFETAQETQLVRGETLVRIEKPIYGGAFLARLEGKAIFVPLALPGEEVRVRISQDKRGYSTAEVEEIVVTSPERIEPSCKHFGACGGCNYQHTGYAQQLEFKRAILRETLERGGVQAPDEIAVLAGEPWGYRNRIRLAFDAVGRMGYRGRRSHAVIPLEQCPIAAPALVDAARAAEAILRSTSAQGLRPTEIALFTDAEQSAMLVSVFVRTAAKAQFETLMRALSERVPAVKGAELLVEFAPQGRKPVPMPRTVAQWGERSLMYSAAGFDYRVDHGAFFQVNRWLVDALVERVTSGAQGKLAWDLFAGVGLFARRLVESVERVVAVESAPMATKALAANLSGTCGTAVNQATADFLRKARKGERPDLVVMDPPRMGLGAETTDALGRLRASEMVYVSCDPATLARDLKALAASGYAIEQVAMADLFPQTFHLETVVRLRLA
jgi:23S rRNA (uracil1939-C5)-methyltransferase